MRFVRKSSRDDQLSKVEEWPDDSLLPRLGFVYLDSLKIDP